MIMSNLNVVCLLLFLSLGYCLAQRRSFNSALRQNDININCPYLRHYIPTWKKGHSMRNILRLQHTIIVQKIVIDTTTCHADRQLIERNFSVSYQDASDKLRQELVYSKSLSGRWGQLDAKIEILLDPVIYSDHVTLTASYPIKCSSITILGCSTDEMCPINHCKNNGNCIGNGRCACQKGYMGSHCEVPASKMPVDNYEIIAALPNLLITKDAVFDVTGDVSFSYSNPETTTRKKRFYHHSSSHFHGNGGSCTYSSSHSSGLSSNGHSTYGYSPSNSRCSSILTSPCGFSYNSQMSFGHNHDHSGTSYLYSTHGTSHYSHGASMHYSNNQLCMHVHNSHQSQYGHYSNEHYQVVAPFFPKPDVLYNICSSFSPHFGASMFVNGHPLASQTKPSSPVPMSNTPLPQLITTPHPSQQSLCFGSCGASTGTGHHNYSISNFGICGGSVPFLASNNILGLLGKTMLNLLFHHAPTTAAPITNVINGLTKAPTVSPPTTTLPPASATSAGHPHTSTSKYAPVCLDCVHMSSPGNCSSVIQCNPGDVCLILHDKFGYTQRCISKQDCDKGVSKTLVDCWECCSGNLCNDKCTPSTNAPSDCQDEPQCLSLKSLGAYYDVCNDPIYSSTVCKQSCGNCP